jgi:hypothetical protein
LHFLKIFEIVLDSTIVLPMLESQFHSFPAIVQLSTCPGGGWSGGLGIRSGILKLKLSHAVNLKLGQSLII